MNFDFGDIAEMSDRPKPEPEPRATVELDQGAHARVSVGPLPQGRGITLGSPLRSALYRSLTGYGVAGVVIEDFALDDAGLVAGTLTGSESLVLALRAARIVHSGDGNPPARGRLSLDATGDKGARVFLGDLDGAGEFKVVNTDAPVAELSGDRGLRASVFFMAGRGYAVGPAFSPGPGRFVTDARFTPVSRAEYSVERVHVEARTDYERLIVSVWTDGTIGAMAALSACGLRLSRAFEGVSGALGGLDPAAGLFHGLEPGQKVDADIAALYARPLEVTGAGNRTVNTLRRARLESVMDVLTLDAEDLLTLRGFGETSYADLVGALGRGGYLDALPPDSHWRVSSGL